jgi:omega-amidase
MQDLKITLVQSTQFWEDKMANLNHFDSLLESVENTDLIVLPEMFHTGFSMNPIALAENMDNSLAINWLKEKAKLKNAAIYTSFIAVEQGCFFNRGVFVFPSGELEIYNKRKLFSLAGENEVFSAGNTETIVHFKGWKIQLQICYDLRFPEIARNRWVEPEIPAYDLLLYVANWPEKRAPHWNALLVARAIENQCFVVGVNRVGIDGKKLTYVGDSVVVNALGDAIYKAKPGQEMCETVTVQMENLVEIRQQLAFLKDVSC